MSPASPPKIKQPSSASDATTCEDRTWHYQIQDGCINTAGINTNSHLIYKSLAECCAANFKGVDCICHDVCVSSTQSAVSGMLLLTFLASASLLFKKIKRTPIIAIGHQNKSSVSTTLMEIASNFHLIALIRQVSFDFCETK